MSDNQRRAAEVVDAWDNGYLGTLDDLIPRIATALDEAEARGRREGRDEMAQEHIDGSLS